MTIRSVKCSLKDWMTGSRADAPNDPFESTFSNRLTINVFLTQCVLSHSSSTAKTGTIQLSTTAMIDHMYVII